MAEFPQAALKSVSVHNCSIGYAAEVLADYGPGDWDWLIHDLADAMDDAAMSAADDWMRDYKEALESACHLPRWCPCGRWADFGIGCWYHGTCECVKREIASADLYGPTYFRIVLAYSADGWRWEQKGYNGEARTPALDRGCPVHPDGPIPADVFAKWDGNRDPLALGGQYGMRRDDA